MAAAMRRSNAARSPSCRDPLAGRRHGSAVVTRDSMAARQGAKVSRTARTACEQLSLVPVALRNRSRRSSRTWAASLLSTISLFTERRLWREGGPSAPPDDGRAGRGVAAGSSARVTAEASMRRAMELDGGGVVSGLAMATPRNPVDPPS